MTILELLAHYSPERESPNGCSFGGPLQALLEPLLSNQPLRVLEVGEGDRVWKRLPGVEVTGVVVKRVEQLVEFAAEYPGHFHFVDDVQTQPLTHRLAALDALWPLIAQNGLLVMERVSGEDIGLLKGKGGVVVDRRAFNPVAFNLMAYWRSR